MAFLASTIGQFSDSAPAVLKMTGVGSISGGEAMSRLEGQSRPLNTSHMSDVLNEKAGQRVGLLVDGQK